MTSVQLPPSGLLRAWVDTFEPMTEAPAEAQLATGIAIVSAGVGWKAPIRWGTSSEPCTISSILEGGSAMGRKTTTMNGGRAIVHEATGDIPPEHRGLFAHMLGHTSDVGLLELVAPKDKEEAERWESTPPPGHVLNWDEMGGILGDPGVARKGGDWHGRTRTTMMSLANGRHGGIKTGAKKFPSARCAVAIVGTMTRVELEQRVDTGLLCDGFLGRFMLIPHNGRARLLSQPPAWTPAQVEAKQSIVQWVRMLSERREPFGDAFSLFTPAALEERKRWYIETTRRLDREADRDPTDATRAAVEAFARLQTTQVKLAVCAAVSDMPTSKLATGTPIVTLEHAQWAQSVIDTSFQEVVELARGGGQNPEDEYRGHVVAYLATRGKVPRKELLHNCTFKQISAHRRWSIIRDLHEDGTLAVELEQTSGRPRQVIAVTRDTDAYDRPPEPETATNGRSPTIHETRNPNGHKPDPASVPTSESRDASESYTRIPPLTGVTTHTDIHRDDPENSPQIDTPPSVTSETPVSPPEPDPYILPNDDIPF